MVHLFGAGREFGFAAPVDDCRLGTQSLGGAHGVHRHVAAAHYDYLAARLDGRVVVGVEGTHQVGAGQEFVGRDHAVEVLARNTHETGQSGARTDENGVESLLVEQGVDRQGAADDDVGLDGYAQPAQGVDLALHDPRLRQTELGNAVDQHAAHLVQRLEDVHLVARLSQVAGAGQTGRTAADHGDAAAVARGGRHLGFVFQRPVAHVALQLADGYRFALDAQDAGPFALRLLRADASADRRQRAVSRDDGRCCCHPAVLQFADEIGNPDADGAATQRGFLQSRQRVVSSSASFSS